MRALTGRKSHLYEKIASSPDGGTAPAVGYGPKSRLFYAMQGILREHGLVAIFWTSQGIPQCFDGSWCHPVFYKENLMRKILKVTPRLARLVD